MQKDWHLWNKVFAEAGLRDPNNGLWIDHSHMSGVHFYDFIYMTIRFWEKGLVKESTPGS